jgi:hypothetical protein
LHFGIRRLLLRFCGSGLVLSSEVQGEIGVRRTAELVNRSPDVTEVDDIVKGPIGRVEVDTGLASHGWYVIIMLNKEQNKTKEKDAIE